MSTLNLENIKHPDSASNNISVDSSGNTIANGNVGIGTSSPAVPLHVYHATTNGVTRFESGDSDCLIQFKDSGTTLVPASVGASGNNFVVQTNFTERMRIDSAGRVTMPYQPAFFAYFSSNTAISSGVYTVSYDLTAYNTGNHFSTSTSTFTAPVSGVYQFNTAISIDSNSSVFGYLSSEVLVNGGTRWIGGWHSKGSHSGYHAAKTSFSLYLSANDTVKHRYENSTAATMLGGTGSPQTFFSGYLIG